MFCEYTRFSERKALLEYRFRELKNRLVPCRMCDIRAGRQNLSFSYSTAHSCRALICGRKVEVCGNRVRFYDTVSASVKKNTGIISGKVKFSFR